VTLDAWFPDRSGCGRTVEASCDHRHRSRDRARRRGTPRAEPPAAGAGRPGRARDAAPAGTRPHFAIVTGVGTLGVGIGIMLRGGAAAESSIRASVRCHLESPHAEEIGGQEVGLASCTAWKGHGPVGPRRQRDSGSAREIRRASRRSVSANRALVRDAATIRRQDHRGGRVRFPPPPPIFLPCSG